MFGMFIFYETARVRISSAAGKNDFCSPSFAVTKDGQGADKEQRVCLTGRAIFQNEFTGRITTKSTECRDTFSKRISTSANDFSPGGKIKCNRFR